MPLYNLDFREDKDLVYVDGGGTSLASVLDGSRVTGSEVNEYNAAAWSLRGICGNKLAGAGKDDGDCSVSSGVNSTGDEVSLSLTSLMSEGEDISTMGIEAKAEQATRGSAADEDVVLMISALVISLSHFGRTKEEEI